MHFHFVYPEGESHLDRSLEGTPRWPLFYGAPAAWALQGYYNLRDHLAGKVTIGSAPEQGAVNIAASGTLRRLARDLDLSKFFLVNCLTDKPDYVGADVCIVQNKELASGPRRHWMPLWPQPELIPRGQDSARPRIVGFFGRPRYGLSQGVGRRGLETLHRLGYQYQEIPATHWHDYSEVDVAVGIRRFGDYPYHHKPPSKLINAWHARVPFVGGADSAYTQVGQPGIDFLRVTTKAELVEALDALRDPELREQLITAGIHSSQQYNSAEITARWVHVLSGPVLSAFEHWTQNPSSRRPRRGPWAIRRQVIGTRLGRRTKRF